MQNTENRIIIIGAGLTGLTLAYYLKKAGKNILLIEKNDRPGGVIQTKTENGLVRGIEAADPRITAFRGVPFAAPPTGKNRWRAPQPCEN